MSVCCECCVLSGGGLCDGLITGPEESYGCGASFCVIYEDRTESHEQLFFFACQLETADEGECGGRWNQLLSFSVL